VGAGTCSFKWCSISRDIQCQADTDCPAGETCSSNSDGTGANGYPCRDQIGRGTNQDLYPLYSWNNLATGTIATQYGSTPVPIVEDNGGGTCYTSSHIQSDRDYCSQNPSAACGTVAGWAYTPYACPHPLMGLTGSCSTGAGTAAYNVVGTSGGSPLWSGILDPSRAIDWSQAGIPGGLPDAGWTQCGTTITAYTGSAGTITAALADCSPNQYVLLGPGTFTLSTSIDFGSKSHLVLRGSGANQTTLIFSGTSNAPECNLGTAAGITICGNAVNWWSSPTVYNWTAGYAQGSNQITLSGTAGITLLGSGSPTFLVLNQDDDGYSGYPASGSSVDNGNYFVCADQYNATGPTGCANDGPDGTPPSPFAHRWQEEIVTVTAINGNTVTISPPLKHPNWRAAQSPTAILFTPNLVQDGVENLSIDEQGNSALGYAIDIWGLYQGWVSGVEVENIYNWGIGANYSKNLQIQNNYIYNGSPGPDPYGIRFSHTADNLFINNIFQKIRLGIAFDNPDTGSVIAYNFAVNAWDNTDAMFAQYWDHSTSDDFHLWEGNIGTGFDIDLYHGTHFDETTFRNFSAGWESCANGQCGSQTAKDWGTIPIYYAAYNRYGNIIGNVLGTPGYHNTYLGPCPGNKCIYQLGTGDAGVPPDDVITATTSLRWGNWDVVNAATQWNPSEVPSTISPYSNAVPANQNLPASFFLSSKPSWWPSTIPWPPIGPDVSGGNVGFCSGTLNTPGQFAGVPTTSNSQCTGTSLVAGWAGHVNANPAMNCYLDEMGGVPDGTGNALGFNASTCYGNASSQPPPPTTTTNSSVLSPRVYPNPWRSDRGYPAQITFDQLTGNTTIKIFTVSGHLVKTLTTGSTSESWLLDNNSGDKVASGIYLYRVTNDQGQQAKGKLAIIK